MKRVFFNGEKEMAGISKRDVIALAKFGEPIPASIYDILRDEDAALDNMYFFDNNICVDYIKNWKIIPECDSIGKLSSVESEELLESINEMLTQVTIVISMMYRNEGYISEDGKKLIEEIAKKYNLVCFLQCTYNIDNIKKLSQLLGYVHESIAQYVHTRYSGNSFIRFSSKNDLFMINETYNPYEISLTCKKPLKIENVIDEKSISAGLLFIIMNGNFGLIHELADDFSVGITFLDECNALLVIEPHIELCTDPKLTHIKSYSRIR